MKFGGRLAAAAMPGRRVWLAVLAAGLLAAAATACGSGGESADGSARAAAGAPAGDKQAADQPEKPQFGSDFERTCADGIGFAGVPAYSRTAKGPQPAVLLAKSTSAWTQQSTLDDEFPRGWILGVTGDLGTARLVVCQERTNSAPAGKTCQMKDQDTGEQYTMTLYNTQYRLRVLEARTGKVLYNKLAQAKSTECPTLTFVTGDEDRTKYYTEARPRDYRAVLKRFITPAAG